MREHLTNRKNAVNVIVFNKSCPRRPILESQCAVATFPTEIMILLSPLFHPSSFYFMKLWVILVKLNICGLVP